jgi:S-methylmethionine-dependent homocysteine/selenocysteine methylase
MTDIILLEGGTGQELLNRSANKSPRHWSAEYLLTEPDLVRAVHRDYIEAGARVITVNAYAASFTRMALLGEADRVPDLQRLACELALAARDDAGAAGHDVAIAGCLPPLNGTYRPDRVRQFEENLAEYRRLAALQAPHVDLFRCETLSTAQEARAAAVAAAETGRPVWVSWTLDDAGSVGLRSGESITEANAALSGIGVAAVLANCTSPEAIGAAMAELVATGLPTGGYANGFMPIPRSFLPGRTLAQVAARRDLDPAAYARFAMDWVSAGATIIGGCCETGPTHIACLRDQLIAGGYRIVSPLTN